jgi:hypothetical protein
MAAVTQIRHRHSKGRAYYDKKLAEGKTPKESLRSLKRQISDAMFACLQADARRGAARGKGPGGQQGDDSVASAAGSHPRHRLFGQATPGPRHHPTTAASNLAPGPARHLRSGPIALQPAGARGRAGHSSTAAILPSAKPQVQVETAPAAKRGRRTWRRGETTATLGHEEGQGPRFAGEPTAPEGRHTPAKDRRNPLTQRGFRYGQLSDVGCRRR